MTATWASIVAAIPGCRNNSIARGTPARAVIRLGSTMSSRSKGNSAGDWGIASLRDGGFTSWVTDGQARCQGILPCRTGTNWTLVVESHDLSPRMEGEHEACLCFGSAVLLYEWNPSHTHGYKCRMQWAGRQCHTSRTFREPHHESWIDASPGRESVCPDATYGLFTASRGISSSSGFLDRN